LHTFFHDDSTGKFRVVFVQPSGPDRTIAVLTSATDALFLAHFLNGGPGSHDLDANMSEQGLQEFDAGWEQAKARERA
jgi:hypothetical protein